MGIPLPPALPAAASADVVTEWRLTR